MQTIVEGGEVTQGYDSDIMFPVWGFVGRMHNVPVSHCINLT